MVHSQVPRAEDSQQASRVVGNPALPPPVSPATSTGVGGCSFLLVLPDP